VDRKTTARQQAILSVIKDFTREHGYPPSVREIGERVGLSSSSTVQCHLRTLEKKGLIKRDPTKPRALVSESDSVARDVVTLPIVSRIAAGGLNSALENKEGELALPSAYVKNANAFMFRVKGDSMVEAGIFDGDLIVVNPQKTANNGEVVVAQVEGKFETEATVKTFYKEDNRIRLQPENKFMEPIYVDANTQIDIVGKVSALIRKL